MGVYLVYYRDTSVSEADVFEESYTLKPADKDYDFFTDMRDVADAIKADEFNEFYEDGDTREYCIIDLCTNTMKTIRATYCLTPSIVID